MDPSLYKAITSGNIVSLIQIASNDGRALLQKTHTMNTTLHLAVQFERINCVERIWNRSPTSLLMEQNSKGDTPLHIAARLGFSDIVTLLIECARQSIYQGVDIERGREGSSTTTVQQLVRMSNKENDTALHEALRYHRLEVVKKLLEADPGFEYAPNNAGNETPLYLAAEAGLYEYVDEILKKCPASAHTGPRGMSALHVAAMSGNSGITKLLLDNKPNTVISELDENGCSALHYAAYFAKIVVVDLLLEADIAADPKSSVACLSDKDGKTALHIAAGSRMPRSLAHMLKKDGRIAREFVANSSAEKSLSYELEKSGKAISLVEDDNFRYQRVEVIDKVIESWPGSCEMLDNNGQNFLHVAAEKGHLHVLQYVLKKCKTMNYLINEKDNNGNTALHLVLKSRSLECLKVLCEDERVHKRAINKENLSALDIVLDNLETAYGSYEEFLWKAYGYLREEGGSIWNGRRLIKEEEERYEATIDTDGRGRKEREAMEKLSQIQMVVAILIATVTFAAGFTVPGGFNSDGNHKGLAILRKKPEFVAFVASNTVAMILSTSTVFIHFWSKIVSNERKLRKKIEETQVRIYFAIIAMTVAFLMGSFSALGFPWVSVASMIVVVVFVIGFLDVQWIIRSRWFNPFQPEA